MTEELLCFQVVLTQTSLALDEPRRSQRHCMKRTRPAMCTEMHPINWRLR